VVSQAASQAALVDSQAVLNKPLLVEIKDHKLMK
jgi:hypothetical protein